MSYNFKWREELYIWKIKYVYNKMTASDIFHQIMSSRLSVIIFKYFGAETQYTKLMYSIAVGAKSNQQGLLL